MDLVNKTSEILLQALQIPVILHLIEIDFLTKYLVENAVNSISEPLDFKIFWRDKPPVTKILATALHWWDASALTTGLSLLPL